MDSSREVSAGVTDLEKVYMSRWKARNWHDCELILVFSMLLASPYVSCWEIDWSTYRLMDSLFLIPRILTPFNYVDWREDMQVSLHKLGLFRMTMGRETDPHQPTKKNKFLNRLDESFGFLCTHISRDLLFHLEGLKISKEYWEKLELLFQKNMSLEGISWRMR